MCNASTDGAVYANFIPKSQSIGQSHAVKIHEMPETGYGVRNKNRQDFRTAHGCFKIYYIILSPIGVFGQGTKQIS